VAKFSILLHVVHRDCRHMESLCLAGLLVWNGLSLRAFEFDADTSNRLMEGNSAQSVCVYAQLHSCFWLAIKSLCTADEMPLISVFQKPQQRLLSASRQPTARSTSTAISPGQLFLFWGLLFLGSVLHGEIGVGPEDLVTSICGQFSSLP
jgi:hypothetical protein